MNIPTSLTLSRAIASPIFFILYLSPSVKTKIIGFLIFILAAISDFLDGYIAKRLKLTTKAGRLLDPIADKLLTSFALLYLSITSLVPWFITILIIGRECLVTALRLSLMRGKESVLKPSQLARIKTACLMFSLTFFLAYDITRTANPIWELYETIPLLLNIVLLLVTFLTLFTGAEYLIWNLLPGRQKRQ